MRVFDATRRLRDAFAIPAEDVRQQHLGFLLAWLTAGSREARVAAARLAEAESVGVTMAPDVERRVLEPLVHRWNEHRAAAAAAAPIASAIHAALAPELLRRFHLVEAAIDALEVRGQNPGLGAVLDLAVEEFTWASR